MQSQNTTGNISEYNNNLEYRLRHNDLSRTDGTGPIPGNENTLLRSTNDFNSGEIFRTALSPIRESPTTNIDSPIPSPSDSHTPQETPTFTFILHKEGLKPLPIPGQRKGPSFATFDHGDHIHFLFTTTHTNNLSRTLTTILTFIAASIPLIAAHTTLQRVRYLNRFISYLIRYGTSSISKYGNRLLKPLKQISDSLATAQTQQDSTDLSDGLTFEKCQMYTDHKSE